MSQAFYSDNNPLKFSPLGSPKDTTNTVKSSKA